MFGANYFAYPYFAQGYARLNIQTQETLTTAVTESPSFSRGVSKLVLFILSLATSLFRRIEKDHFVVSAYSATLGMGIGKKLLAAGVQTLLIVRQVYKTTMSQPSYAASISRATGKSISALVIPILVIQLSLDKVMGISVAGSSALGIGAAIAMTAVVSNSLYLQLQISKIISVAANTLAIIIRGGQTTITMIANVVANSTISRAISRRMDLAINSILRIVADTTKSLTSITSSSGSMSRMSGVGLQSIVAHSVSGPRAIGKGILLNIPTIALLIRGFSQTIMAVSVSSVASILNGVGKIIAVTPLTVAGFSIIIGKNLVVNASLSIKIGRHIEKTIILSINSIATMIVSVVKIMYRSGKAYIGDRVAHFVKLGEHGNA